MTAVMEPTKRKHFARDISVNAPNLSSDAATASVSRVDGVATMKTIVAI